jgi:hypothetical protein
MKNTLKLFPNHFKKIGWFIFIPSFIMGIVSLANLFTWPEISLPFLQFRIPSEQ